MSDIRALWQAIDRFGGNDLWRRMGARLLLLLLIAEAPLVAFTVHLAVRNDTLLASDMLARIGSTQQAALARLARDLQTAISIADAARSFPPALTTDPATCDRVLQSLLNVNAGRVAFIAVTDRAGHQRCATKPVASFTGSIGDERSTSLVAAASGLVVVGGADWLPSARVLIGLPAPDNAPSDRPDRVLLWVRLKDAWIAVNTGPDGALPAVLRKTDDGVGNTRLHAARNSHPFLYTSAPLPLAFGDPNGLLLAGSDARSAVTTSRRIFVFHVLELSLFFLAEFLLIAAGVSLVASRPLRRLNDAVDDWRRGGSFRSMQAACLPLEVDAVWQSFAQATRSLEAREHELTTSIAQQEILVQEIHHRVKNNLQIIASLLNLQAARIKAPEARAEFQSARDRVRALATLHRHLYAHGDLHLIDMRAFFTELCGQLFQALDESPGDRIGLEILAPDVTISSDQAVPIALIVTETVGNALKYAFPDRRHGKITVEFEVQDETHATLIVRDDGVGFAQRAGDERGRGLGLQLVRGFARQLGAKLAISSDAGTCYRLDMAIERNRKNTIALGKTARAGGPPG